MKKKISTAEYAETAEDLLPKNLIHESSNEYFNLSASSRISAVWGSFRLLGIKPFLWTNPNEGKRMNEEEAEGAELLPWTVLWSLRISESVENGTFPSPCPRTLSLFLFLPLRALRPLWLSFFILGIN